MRTQTHPARPCCDGEGRVDCPHYNNFADTDECLASLAAVDYPAHELVVVDNGSDDGSVEMLAERWAGQARFIETGKNLGAAAGWNAGVKAVFNESDYFLILNNDVVVAPNLVEQLIAAFEGAPDTALASPVIVSYDRPDIVWFAGGRYERLLGLSTHPGLGRSWRQLGRRFGALVITDYVPLCAALVSKPAFQRTGLFDESFFFGHEDVDWCMRAGDAGLRCRVVGAPLVRHKVSVSSGVRVRSLSPLSRRFILPPAVSNWAESEIEVGALCPSQSVSWPSGYRYIWCGWPAPASGERSRATSGDLRRA